jgi:hypothetical protein
VTKDGNPERHVHEMMENQKENDHKERHERMYSERIDRAKKSRNNNRRATDVIPGPIDPSNHINLPNANDA